MRTLRLSAFTFATVLVLFSNLARGRAMPPSEGDVARLQAAAAALDELRIEEAESQLDGLARAHPNDADVLWERAVLRFIRGDYPGAVRDGASSVVRATGIRPS